MQTSANITSVTTSNKKITKSITNINPQITNEQLQTAARLFTEISNTTYSDTDRIIKMNVNEPYTPSPTTEPNLSIGSFSYDGYRYVATITYNGDGQLFANSQTDTAFCQVANEELRIKCNSATFSGTLIATGGTSYAQKSITFNNN